MQQPTRPSIVPIFALLLSLGSVPSFASGGEIDPSGLDLSSWRTSAVDFDTPGAPGDATIWAMGATYKAEFGVESAIYYPRLGPDAPRNYPISLELGEITVGGQPLEFARVVTPEQFGDSVSYARGSVEERYELTPDSIEQLFVFTERPGAGDLVVRVGIGSELARREESGRFVFEHELGGVSLTKAVALDSSGSELPLATSLQGDVFEIRVPASFVASASYPLTIDPVVSTFSLVDNAGGEKNADIAYDVSFDNYLAVWEVVFSLGDSDIRAQFVNSAGVPVGNGFWVDSTNAHWANPSIANANDGNRFLAVAEVGTGDREIWGRTWSADPTALNGGQFVIAGNPVFSTDKANPDLGGDQRQNLFGVTNFLLVYEQEVLFSPTERDVLMRTVTAQTLPVIGSATILDSVGVATNPSVSKTNGLQQGSQDWAVAWQRNAGLNLQDLYAAEVNPNGNITEPPFPISIGLADDRNPSVSTPVNTTDDREYVVAYQRGDLGGDTDILLARVRMGGTVLGTTNLTSLEGNPNSSGTQANPSVESDCCKFVVAYEDQTSLFNRPIYASTVALSGINGLSLEENRVQLGGSQSTDVRLASTRGAGGAGRRVAAVWTRVSFLGGATSAGGALYEIPGPTNDCCLEATAVAGTGVFEFDNVGASATGLSFGSGCAINNQVWYTWAAPSAGLYSISTCGLTDLDTEIAVFQGSNCSNLTLLDCDDTTCGNQSQVVFNALALNTYKICIGTSSPNQEGAGQFAIHKVSNGGLGDSYCVSGTNSVSASGATISAAGSTSVVANNLIITASPLPTLVPGLFYYGVNQTQQAFGDGFRCVAGQTFRLPVTFASGGGSATFSVDNSLSPHSANLLPGFTWNFQYWYRDPSGPTGNGFNLSNGLELTFLP